MYDDEGVTSSDPEPDAVPDSIDVRRYRSRPARDMLISLGVILVPLLILMAFCRPSASQDSPRADPAGVFRAAQAANAFPVLVPSGVPSGWKATNASLRDGDAGVKVLRVTYQLPSGRFAQLVESNRAAEAMLADELGRGQVLGAEQLGGRSWQKYPGRRDTERALVSLQLKGTVIVAGDAPDADLAALASSLH
jgi:hypothetical protein